MEFDYSKARITEDKGNWGRWTFAHTVLAARQLLHDLVTSGPRPGDTVVRAETLTSERERFDTGLRIALVFLVAQLDQVFDGVFQELYDRRPDALHDWIADNLGIEDKRSSIRLPIRDVWRASTKQKTLEDYFRGRVYSAWSRKSPKDRLDMLQRVLRTPAPEGAVAALEEALEVRNAFVHPRAHTWTDKIGPERDEFVHREDRRHDEPWLDRICAAFVDLAGWVHAEAHELTRQWVAANFVHLQRVLTDEQNVAFGATRYGSGRHFKDVERFLNEIERRLADDAPAVLLLNPSPELMALFNRVEQIAKAHSSIPIVVYEWWDHAGSSEVAKFESLRRFGCRVEFAQNRGPTGRQEARDRVRKLVKQLTGR